MILRCLASPQRIYILLFFVWKSDDVSGFFSLSVIAFLSHHLKFGDYKETAPAWYLVRNRKNPQVQSDTG